MKHIDLFSGIGGFALAVDRVWYDQEIEDEIASHMRAHELSRDEAIMRVFNTPAESGA